MDEKLKKKWVEALRSGSYTQVRGTLFEKEIGGVNAFCCLGVLCDIQPDVVWMMPGEYIANYPDSNISNNDFVNEYYPVLNGLISNGHDAFTYPEIIADTNIGEAQAKTLADMNDGGKGFNEIADYIEEHI